jgi:hypothetical protein
MQMKRKLVVLLTAVGLVAGLFVRVKAEGSQSPLVVTMSNDPTNNQIMVIDAATHTRIQTLSASGKGGVAGNARGVTQYKNQLFAAVNHGSGTVAVFQRVDNQLRLEQLISTTSAPVSVDFANGHLYVAGSTSVDSFRIRDNRIAELDGTAGLVLAGGGAPPEGSTAQVGFVKDGTVLVTIKTDPTPGTVDIVSLKDGAISGPAKPVSAPAGSLTPFGFSTYPDGTALITLAHTNQDGLFRDGAFTHVVNSGGQAGPCWTTRVGKYVFIVNTGSRTISRVLSTGNSIFVDNAVAASVGSGSPTDTDAKAGYLGVIDHSGGSTATSHLTLFRYNVFGELSPSSGPIDLGVPGANGVAIMAGHDRRE